MPIDYFGIPNQGGSCIFNNVVATKMIIIIKSKHIMYEEKLAITKS